MSSHSGCNTADPADPLRPPQKSWCDQGQQLEPEAVDLVEGRRRREKWVGLAYGRFCSRRFAVESRGFDRAVRV
jgi:hypothetical protein